MCCILHRIASINESGEGFWGKKTTGLRAGGDVGVLAGVQLSIRLVLLFEIFLEGEVVIHDFFGDF